mgnify:CR=1 FL=1
MDWFPSSLDLLVIGIIDKQITAKISERIPFTSLALEYSPFKKFTHKKAVDRTIKILKNLGKILRSKTDDSSGFSTLKTVDAIAETWNMITPQVIPEISTDKLAKMFAINSLDNWFWVLNSNKVQNEFT